MKNGNTKFFLKNLVSMCIQEKDGYMWFAASNRNGIYQISNETKNVINKYVFENEKAYEYMLYHNMEISGEKIFFAPHKADKIAIYDTNTNKVEYLLLKPVVERYTRIYNDELKFGNTFQDGSYVYLLGYTYPAILKIHKETLEVSYIDCWVDELINEISDGDTRGYFTMGNVKIDRKVLLPIGYMCGILELDLDTDETRLIKLNASLDGVGGIANDDNGNVWIIGRGKCVNKIIKWDFNDDVIKEIDLPIDEKNCVVPFYAPLCYENNIFLFPIYSNYAYEISVIGESITIHKIFENIISERDEKSKLPMCTFSPRIQDGKLKFITNSDRNWHEYSLKSGKIENYTILDSENIEIDLQEYAKNIIDKDFVENNMWEEIYDLNDYINAICLTNTKRHTNNKKIAGNRIYCVLTGVNMVQ